METEEIRIDLSRFQDKINQLREQVASVVVGQEDAVDLFLTSLLTNGHILIEGVPGIAKTLLAKLMAKLIKADYTRIQFTPDLMPSDVLGTSVFNLKTSEFEFHKGPIFSEVVLIDEINRAPSKTQAALFEVMEEKQVTVDGFTRKMSDLYMVVATQNPIEQEGTYRLPEAQLDRFLMKIIINHPNAEQEFEILKRHHQKSDLNKLTHIEPVITKEELLSFQALRDQVFAEDTLLTYITQLIVETRNNPAIYLGASPRASVALLNASKAFALLQGRDFIIPEDIKFLAIPILQHRLVLSPETEMEGLSAATVIERITNKLEVPR